MGQLGKSKRVPEEIGRVPGSSSLLISFEVLGLFGLANPSYLARTRGLRLRVKGGCCA